jgi:DNA-binding CsgD family transcriptional regulator
LLSGLRRPTASSDLPGALLFAMHDELDALAVRMLAWILDDVGVPVFLVLDGDWHAAQQRACLGHETVACVASSSVDALRHAEPMIRSLRPLRSVTLLTGEHAYDDFTSNDRGPVLVGASRIGEAADMVLHLRGPLTAAEAEVLRLAADGYTNWRIAHEIGVSLSAVKARLESGYAKLNASDRTHAVAIALRKRWIR